MLPKIYQPQKIEKKIYRLWEKTGYFNPDKLPFNPSNKAFSIIMPPPNANDPLHIGHAVFVTLEDIMIRYHRLKREITLWLPGTDHAGFETQVVFEKKLEKEGKSRFEMTKEEFYKAILEYTKKNRKIVKKQLKLLGASCDWTREKFTLDKDIIKIVYETFEELYQDELLYRGKRIVNYCPKHKTAFSELEVKYLKEKGKLYFVRYKFKDNPTKFITVATTRPETIVGDMAIAVNPKDSRYKNFIGKEVIEPILKRNLPVIGDRRVDIDFGTGVLKITPAHDALDFEISKDNHLEMRQTLNFDGCFNELAGPLKGLKVQEAREKTILILKEIGALEKAEDYVHEVSHCYKCNTTIEPMIMDQWFISVSKPFGKNNKSLRDLAVEAIKTGKIEIIPKKFEKVFYHWMNNLKDWNISRQISWGIQIPVFYCLDGKNDLCKKKEGIIVSPSKRISRCPYCGSKNIKKDEDVLDTWFSSGQWPYATLLTTKKNDFNRFYPTSVMETGWDILFFWVVRMIMLGIYKTQKVPFKTVYLHGLVRDKDRQKMSKSKGNVIDPLNVASIYGTDALRMALVVGNSAGSDIIISEEKIKGYRNFANKIYNLSRFLLLSVKDFSLKKPKLSTKDKQILKEFQQIKKKVTFYLDNYRFSLAAETLYHYIWHKYADKIVEAMKPRLKNRKEKKRAEYVLVFIFKDLLVLLHPFMPFLTEYLWQKIPFKKKNPLIVEKWPL
ncbi:MAG TPA: valine--tRNA ligase [Candidatus Paceibacterota bacterium]|nr:valine--tRNA ligase [Candidatus Paceibacterota bacterium]